HGRVGDDAEPRRACAPPAAGRAGVNVAGVEHPDHEGPDLLRVPTPVATPGRLGPDRAGDEREAPEHEADDSGAVGEILKPNSQGEGRHEPRLTRLTGGDSGLAL